MTNHTPAFCQYADCKNEADRWIEDAKYPDQTFYFCLEHPDTEEDPESLNGKEVAVYSCSEDCPDCN